MISTRAYVAGAGREVFEILHADVYVSVVLLAPGGAGLVVSQHADGGFLECVGQQDTV